MNDEILKLANELKITCVKGDREEILTTFYRAAYNKAIEDACGPVRDRMIGFAVDDYDLKMLNQDIKALEMK